MFLISRWIDEEGRTVEVRRNNARYFYRVLGHYLGHLGTMNDFPTRKEAEAFLVNNGFRRENDGATDIPA